MITVVIALLPCMGMAMYNTGYQALLAMAQGAVPLDSWQAWLCDAIGFSFDFKNPIDCIVYGALYYLPVVVAAMATGGIVEPLVAMIRKHEINEGFLVTGMLIPLTLPPTIPLWMVVVGTAFGTIFAKEIFGGTGMNFLNPALTARAFLFFAYPAAHERRRSLDRGGLHRRRRLLGRHLARPGGGLGRDGPRGRELDECLPRLRARLDGRDLDARGVDRRVPADLDGHRILANDGRRGGRHHRDGRLLERRRLGHEPDVRRAVVLARGARRLGLRHGLHGDRPGLLGLHRTRAS